MTSFAFNAGVATVNTAVKAADLTVAGAKAAKHYGTKGAATTTKVAKSAALSTKDTAMSFWDGVKFARSMNKALTK